MTIFAATMRETGAPPELVTTTRSHGCVEPLTVHSVPDGKPVIARSGRPSPSTSPIHENDDGGDETATEGQAAEPIEAVDSPRTITAEEAIAGLRAKIDRLGPVNMMAIEQFDELETRHAFLTTQRKDLIDSIAAM